MPIYITTRCIPSMADSSSEEENECGDNFPNPNCCYVHFSFIKFVFSLTKQVLDAHSSMLTTIFYMITPIVCPGPLLKVFFGNIYCLHVTLIIRGKKTQLCQSLICIMRMTHPCKTLEVNVNIVQIC